METRKTGSTNNRQDLLAEMKRRLDEGEIDEANYEARKSWVG